MCVDLTETKIVSSIVKIGGSKYGGLPSDDGGVGRTLPRVLRLPATVALSCVLAEVVQSTQRSYKGEKVDSRSIIDHFERWNFIYGVAAIVVWLARPWRMASPSRASEGEAAL
jgi:hypothetical protein